MRVVLGAATIIGIALGAMSAQAAIVDVAQDVFLIAAPADVRLNQLQSDVNIFAFNERQCFPLPAELLTDEDRIPAGTQVSCHLLHHDTVNANPLMTGKARFTAPIIGVISSSTLLDASDSTCSRSCATSPAPCIIYPAAGVEPDRGLEGPPAADRYRIILGGFGIEVRMEGLLFTDQVRVVTRCS
jgi:hypothetical protein